MKLYFSALLVLTRDGRRETVAQALNIGPSQEGVAEVQDAHRRLIAAGAEGDKLRASIARALVIVDNNPLASYEFPAPEIVALDKLAADTAQARADLELAAAAADAARRTADALALKADEAAARLRSLARRLSPGRAKISTEDRRAASAAAKGASPASGGNAGDNPGATSLLEHVAALDPGAPLALTPPANPPRLADGIDLTPTASQAETPTVAASASTTDAGSQPPAEGVEAKPAEGSADPAPAQGEAPAETGTPAPLDLLAAASKSTAKKGGKPK